MPSQVCLILIHTRDFTDNVLVRLECERQMRSGRRSKLVPERALAAAASLQVEGEQWEMEKERRENLGHRRTRPARHLGTTTGHAGPRKRLRGLKGGTQEDSSSKQKQIRKSSTSLTQGTWAYVCQSTPSSLETHSTTHLPMRYGPFRLLQVLGQRDDIQ
jgi:hypothetical protein